MAVLVATMLVSAVLGGLLRAGLAPLGEHAELASRTAAFHAALMLPGLFGTVIALERAVALRARWGFAVPLLTAGAALLILAGARSLGTCFQVLGAVGFMVLSAALWRRQRAPHTTLLVAAAVTGFIGNALFATGADLSAVLPWWFLLPVLTIAAERLEMTRLTLRRTGTQPALLIALAMLCVGATLSAHATPTADATFGLGLAALGLWLLRYDIARQTLHAGGLPRFMAICLLCGYGWLVLAGMAWGVQTLWPTLWPWHDAALHALGIGFILGMVMAHAPVILPALLGIKLSFGRAFYLPLILLQGSLLLRVGGAASPALFRLGAALNGAALLSYALTVVGAAVAWHMRSEAHWRR